MAGIYIHIPFCKTRCAYCDFFSSIDFSLKDKLIDAICTELKLEKNYIGNEIIKTIYFGGGTPSLLASSDFQKIFDVISKTFDISQCEEITLEANPDDLSDEYVASICRLPFNRISIGMQSLVDSELAIINRRHTAKQAINAVETCIKNSIANISVDLIYGYPSQKMADFLFSIDNVLKMNVKHISAYHLTYEKNTPLGEKLLHGKIKPIDEELSLKMYQLLVERLAKKGFIQYEISNFSQAGFESKHNSSYWKGSNYLGVGPSAHSYNGNSRKWNVASIKDYIKGIMNNESVCEIETLSETDKYNDFIITSLRTVRGASLLLLEEKFGKEKLDYCLKNAHKYLKRNILYLDNNYLKFTQKGFTLSDGVMSDLLFIEE
jgi:oxygen-independent coproporphyrinogen-3 oxidase